MSFTHAAREVAGSGHHHRDHHQHDGPREFLADRLPAMDLTAVFTFG